MNSSKSNEALSFKKVWLLFQESNKQLKGAEKKLMKLYAAMAGIGKNKKVVAEEFFFNALKNNENLLDINYNYTEHLVGHNKKLSCIFDIVLFGDDHIILVEVKHKLHLSDVTDFCDRKLVDFRLQFPKYSPKKLFGCIAAQHIPSKSLELASQNGIIVITKDNNTFRVLNDKYFKPSCF